MSAQSDSSTPVFVRGSKTWSANEAPTNIRTLTVKTEDGITSHFIALIPRNPDAAPKIITSQEFHKLLSIEYVPSEIEESLPNADNVFLTPAKIWENLNKSYTHAFFGVTTASPNGLKAVTELTVTLTPEGKTEKEVQPLPCVDLVQYPLFCSAPRKQILSPDHNMLIHTVWTLDNAPEQEKLSRTQIAFAMKVLDDDGIISCAKAIREKIRQSPTGLPENTPVTPI